MQPFVFVLVRARAGVSSFARELFVRYRRDLDNGVLALAFVPAPDGASEISPTPTRIQHLRWVVRRRVVCCQSHTRVRVVRRARACAARTRVKEFAPHRAYACRVFCDACGSGRGDARAPLLALRDFGHSRDARDVHTHGARV